MSEQVSTSLDPSSSEVPPVPKVSVAMITYNHEKYLAQAIESVLMHDCVISDGVHIGPGCRVAGGVTVGKYAWLGIGATVIDKRSIGEDSIVGAGAVVIRDVPDAMVVAGVPARTLRPNI